MPRTRFVGIVLALVGLSVPAVAQVVVPHNQSRPPGDPLTPDEAVRRMKVPPGFRVEVVAAEPDLVNPVAMTFDERGRIWVTESLEYPRRSPGPGRDRVKILEDTDQDGKVDRTTIFADGLNIPSGIAVGHGGVWVANAPDILFLRDTDGDGKADSREVIVTGFGRDDTHELPNSLTWGPDGWLYGWNGVFNRSRVAYRGKTYDFTCAIFRIHPRTRDFELFCEGTSNPWGIAWDHEGAAFASACVIDHLWHLTETGYYHRQGGPYPPHTWKIGSIVNYKHQQAAYCGIHFFDSDAYPESYRNRLYLGNIHGNCINVDSLTRNGSTYKGKGEPDFLQANDPWFMPVSQKTGPDGCLYILDWYDRYHCYQDANRDPAGIDRLKGRLYRVRYNDTPRRPRFDLASATDAQLLASLGSGNGYDRETARRVLAERTGAETDALLENKALDPKEPRKSAMNALWTRVSRGTVGKDFLQGLLAHADPGFRAWGVRTAGTQKELPQEVVAHVLKLGTDPAPDVRLQVVIASRKLLGARSIPTLLDATAQSSEDVLIPRIAWQNLRPILDTPERLSEAVEAFTPDRLRASAGTRDLAVRVVAYAMDRPAVHADQIVRLYKACEEAKASPTCGEIARLVANRILNGEVPPEGVNRLKTAFGPVTTRGISGDPKEALPELALLAGSWNDPRAKGVAESIFRGRAYSTEQRLMALNVLMGYRDTDILGSVKQVLGEKGSEGLVGPVLGALGKLNDDRVAKVVLEAFPLLSDPDRPRAVELLSQRPSWSLALLDAMQSKKVPANLLGVNQARRLMASRDPEVIRRVKAVYGNVREGRNPGREQVIASTRTLLRNAYGDPNAGARVFEKVCAQCHKIYGQGQDVGPEITGNGRGSYEQLLSNVLDPSLVIGSSYQATMVATTDGRVLTGLTVEDNPQRLILKTQGGKLETVPRGMVDQVKISEVSLMPEDLEKQLQPQELVDLFSFLTLDRHPSDPRATPIPGAEGLRRNLTGK